MRKPNSVRVRFWAWVVMGSLMGFVLPVTGYAADPVEDIAEKWLPAIVKITSPGEDAGGSGVIIDATGAILTTEHVVQGRSSLRVTFQDGHSADTADVLHDPASDLALVRLQPRDAVGLIFASFGDSDALHLGQQLLVLATPSGLSGAVQVTHVGAKARRLGVQGVTYEDFLQLDVAPQPATSGGGVFDMTGKLVGILDTNPAGGTALTRLSHAISGNLAKAVGTGLLRYGKVPRAYLGARTARLDSTERQRLGVTTGVKVVEMPTTETPAQKAGLRVGDVITAVGARAVNDPADLDVTVAHQLPYHTIELTVVRDRNTLKFYPELWEMPAGGTTTPPQPPKGGVVRTRIDALGIWVQEVTEADAFRYGWVRGQVPARGLLVTQVETGGVGHRSHLQVGTVLVEGEKRPLNTAGDLVSILSDERLRDGALLVVAYPDGQKRYSLVRI